MRGGLSVLDLIEDLCGGGTVSLCRPPHVPVPKPGPCPKIKDRVKDAVGAPAKTTRKAATPRKTARARHAPVKGRDIRDELDYDLLDKLPTSGPDGNHRMQTVAHAQGFDAHPTLDDAAFDAAIAAGGRRLFRGTDARPGRSGQDRQREFAHGTPEYGTGLYGNGFYFSNNQAFASTYGQLRDGIAEPGTVGEYVLPKTARTIDYSKLLAQMGSDTTPGQQQIAQAQAQLLDALRAASKGSREPAIARRVAWEDYEAKVRRTGTTRDRILADPGTYAMAKGYDAYIVRLPMDMQEIVLLNRGAVIGRPANVPNSAGLRAGAAAHECDKERLEACRPPHVPVPRPGPCKGWKSAEHGIAQARARSAQFDHARKQASILAELEELTLKQASPQTLQSRYDSSLRRHEIERSPALDDLAAKAAGAAQTQNYGPFNTALKKVVKSYGLRHIDPYGAQQVPFDHKKHKLVGGGRTPAAGTVLYVVRPGYQYRYHKEDWLTLDKTLVEE